MGDDKKKDDIKKTEQKIFKTIHRIVKESKTAESFGTSLAQEHIIVASYNQMSIDKLEAMRHIINKLIKRKKEMKRVNDSIRLKIEQEK